jgi:hypothetical protein
VSYDPFPHFVGFVTDLSLQKERLNKFFEDEFHWNLRVRSFYSQWENAIPIEKCELLSPFWSKEWLECIRDTVESRLKCNLAPPVKINLIRLTEGQSINIHNDSPKLGFETHRVLVYLADAGPDFSGGELVLFRENHPSCAAAAFHPKAGVVIGFEASNSSYHCVMPITSGNRYAIQYYFWASGNQPEIAEKLISTIQNALSSWNNYEPAKPIVKNLESQMNLDLAHGNSNLLNHLAETSALLFFHGADEPICIAGLVHSVGGTKNFAANGDLTQALSHRSDASEIISLVKCYADITDSEDLIRLMEEDPNKGERVLQIWWANVLSSKAHITFSKKRHDEERRVFLRTQVKLDSMRALLAEIYK